jgi:hypothetical protein
MYTAITLVLTIAIIAMLAVTISLSVKLHESQEREGKQDTVMVLEIEQEDIAKLQKAVESKDRWWASLDWNADYESHKEFDEAFQVIERIASLNPRLQRVTVKAWCSQS